MSIAERLISLRGKESRAAFAARLGISANTLRNYEAGLSLPNSDIVAKICITLDIDPGWLLLEREGGHREAVKANESVRHHIGTSETNSDQRVYKAEQTPDNDVLSLPPTSTIEDNKDIFCEIESLYDELHRLLQAPRPRYLDISSKIADDFSIPSDAKYKSYKLWPESLGKVLINYLRLRIDAVNTEGPESLWKGINMIPSDVDLNKREAEIFRRFNITSTSKDVVSWFSNFFGKDTKLKRSRFCRWAFVMYAEDHLSSL